MTILNRLRSVAQSAQASLAIATFCLLGTSSAYAKEANDNDSRHPIYVQVDLGFSPQTHTTFDGSRAGRMHHDGSAFPASLTIGLKPAAWQNDMGGWAIELSAYSRDLVTDRLMVGSTSQASDGRLRIGGLMANVRYELNTGGALHPYLTGGAGVACARITDMPALKLKDEKATDAKIAAHFGAGVGFQPKALGRASLWLGYDILTMQAPQFETAPTGSIRVKHVLPQTVTVGARFAF